MRAAVSGSLARKNICSTSTGTSPKIGEAIDQRRRQLAEEPRLLGALGVEVPRRRQQAPAPRPGRPALRQRHRQQARPCNSRARRSLPAGPRHRRRRRAFEPSGDIVGETEAALDLARGAPIEQQRPQARARDRCRSRLVSGSQIEHIGLVDQRRHHQHRRAAVGAIVQEPRGALLPHTGGSSAARR